MEPLKPRDKVTQHMTRDGLTLDNQTTGESVNVSSREAEQEYTAQPEGAAEKILERADELHDRHRAKKAAKDAGETVAQATGPVSRLQFTAEERASPELEMCIRDRCMSALTKIKQDTFLSKFILISNPSRKWSRSQPDVYKRQIWKPSAARSALTFAPMPDRGLIKSPPSTWGCLLYTSRRLYQEIFVE